MKIKKLIQLWRGFKLMKKVVATAILAGLTGIALGAGGTGKFLLEKMDKIQLESDKHLSLFLMMNQWVKIKQSGKELSTYFEKNGYKKIAVYGMSHVGNTLIQELNNTQTVVAYGIDKNRDSTYTNLDIVSIEEDMEPVDAVVVTAITYYEEIKKMLLTKVECPIISIEDILYEI